MTEPRWGKKDVMTVLKAIQAFVSALRYVSTNEPKYNNTNKTRPEPETRAVDIPTETRSVNYRRSGRPRRPGQGLPFPRHRQ